MNKASQNHVGCDVTGIAAFACVWSGAFIPGSVVDFRKGERQMNINYKLCEALKTMVVGDGDKIMIIMMSCANITSISGKESTKIHFFPCQKRSSYLWLLYFSCAQASRFMPFPICNFCHSWCRNSWWGDFGVLVGAVEWYISKHLNLHFGS